MIDGGSSGLHSLTKVTQPKDSSLAQIYTTFKSEVLFP